MTYRAVSSLALSFVESVKTKSLATSSTFKLGHLSTRALVTRDVLNHGGVKSRALSEVGAQIVEADIRV